MILAGAAVFPVYGKGFFEVLYAQKAVQGEDLDGILDDADSTGVAFGYDTEIAGSGVFLDIELGYEVGEHDLPAVTSFRNHRGFLGMRLKYGGFGYIEPYVGYGVMAYAYYERQDSNPEDLEITKNLSGSYLLLGVDFFFSKDGSFYIGLEQRTMQYTVAGVDSKTEYDIEVERLAFKIGILF